MGIPPNPNQRRLAVLLVQIIWSTIGSYYGSRRFDHAVIKRLLAVVLLVAGLKLVLTS